MTRIVKKPGSSGFGYQENPWSTNSNRDMRTMFKKYYPYFYPIPKLIAFGFVKAKAKWSFKNHCHEAYEWIFVKKGKVIYWLDGEEYQAKAGDFYFVQPGQSHREKSIITPLVFYYMQFYFRDVNGNPALFPHDAKIPKAQIIKGGETYFGPFINQIIDEIRIKKPGYEEMVETNILQILWILRRRLNQKFPVQILKEPEKSSTELITMSREYILQNLHRTISLDELSRNCYVSKYHFCHIFKEEIGKSPLQYIINLRIEKARMLLDENRLNITEIAEKVGFSNVFYFSQQFKKVVGISPSRFRNQLKRDRR